MAVAGVFPVRDPLLVGRLGEFALRRVGGALEQLLVDVALARLAQRLERRGVAPAIGQAVPAVAESVRAATEAALGERGVARKLEGAADHGARVITDGERVDVVLARAGDGSAGLLGALGRVLRQVAGAAARVNAGLRADRAHVELGTPADVSSAELVGQRSRDVSDGGAHRRLETVETEAGGWSLDLVARYFGIARSRRMTTWKCIRPRRWYSPTFT